MTQVRPRYATKAKVEHAIRMAQLAGITKVGSLVFGADGTIRVEAAGSNGRGAPTIDDEIDEWRERKGKG